MDRWFFGRRGFGRLLIFVTGFYRRFDFSLGSSTSLSADSLYEFVESVADWFFWFGFGLVGANHSPCFANGLDHVAVACVGAVDDLFEAIE